MEDCVFCKIAKGELPSHKIFENDLVMVMMDIMPIADGHILVLPKAHYETIFDMNENLACEIMKVTWKIANVIRKTLEPDGLNILQNNYRSANQIVPHYHTHLIPRNNNDNLKISVWSAKEADQEKLKMIASQIKKVL